MSKKKKKDTRLGIVFTINKFEMTQTCTQNGKHPCKRICYHTGLTVTPTPLLDIWPQFVRSFCQQHIFTLATCQQEKTQRQQPYNTSISFCPSPVKIHVDTSVTNCAYDHLGSWPQMTPKWTLSKWYSDKFICISWPFGSMTSNDPLMTSNHTFVVVPRIPVRYPKCHENPSTYVGTVSNFARSNNFFSTVHTVLKVLIISITLFLTTGTKMQWKMKLRMPDGFWQKVCKIVCTECYDKFQLQNQTYLKHILSILLLVWQNKKFRIHLLHKYYFYIQNNVYVFWIETTEPVSTGGDCIQAVSD